MTVIKKRLFIFVYDIGAAQIISSVYNTLSAKFEISLCVGPNANQYFLSQTNTSYTVTDTSCEALKLLNCFQPQLVLLGTSNQNQIEPSIIRAAKKLNIKTVSFVDQWQNYQIRFKQKDNWILPNKIILPDYKALEEFKHDTNACCELVCGGQPYLSSLKQRYSIKKPKNLSANVLFISEPISNTLNRNQIEETYGYDEKKALLAIIRLLKQLKTTHHLTVKHHPKDSKTKRATPTCHHRYKTLSHRQLVHYDLVIGMASTMLIEAYILGLQVCIFQPGANTQADHCMLSRYGYLTRCTSSKDLLLAMSRKSICKQRLEFLKYDKNKFVSLIS